MLSLISPNVSSPSQKSYRPLPYWSVQQSEVVPACRVDVSSAAMISATIMVSQRTNCPFAVRSGGHTSWAGGSSIQDGILINLAGLNMVSLENNRTVARIGAGNDWHDVYKVLDPLVRIIPRSFLTLQRCSQLQSQRKRKLMLICQAGCISSGR